MSNQELLSWTVPVSINLLQDLSPDTIETIGTAGSAQSLLALWNRFRNDIDAVPPGATPPVDTILAAATTESSKPKKDSPTPMQDQSGLLSAFISSCMQLRRQPVIISQIVQEMASMVQVAWGPTDIHHIMVLCTDLGLTDVAKALFDQQRGRQQQRLKPATYHTLLKLALENVRTDLPFAIDIVKEMDRQQVSQSHISLRLLMHGCIHASTEAIPTDFIYTVMNRRIEAAGTDLSTIEPCFLHEFFSTLEALPGAYTRAAAGYLARMNPALLHLPVSGIVANSMCGLGTQGSCSADELASYYLIDPFSANLDFGDIEIPRNTFVCFLYSSIRMLSEILSKSPEHPFAPRAEQIKKFLDMEEHSHGLVVCPLIQELYFRPEESNSRPFCPHEKMILFLKGVRRARDKNTECFVLTKNPHLAEQAKEARVRHCHSLPAEWLKSSQKAAPQ